MRTWDLKRKRPGAEEVRLCAQGLLPGESLSRVEVLSGTPTGIHAQDQGDGTVLLEVSQRVPWQTALAVMRLLKLPYDGSSLEGQWH